MAGVLGHVQERKSQIHDRKSKDEVHKSSINNHQLAITNYQSLIQYPKSPITIRQSKTGPLGDPQHIGVLARFGLRQVDNEGLVLPAEAQWSRVAEKPDLRWILRQQSGIGPH